jgi:glycerophosphoryl diester phosphodiesterase
MGLNIENSIYHDNSLESVQLACSMTGCDGVEVDVQLSSDGELWLYHDATLESETNGKGCVADQENTILSKVNYLSIHKEKLCRLNEISDKILCGKKIFLDLRHYNACSGVFVDVDTMIARISGLSFLSKNTWVITNNMNWLEQLKQSGFNVLFQLDEVVAYKQNLDFVDGFIIRNSLVTSDQVNEIHHSGKKLFIFDVRSPKGIRSALEKHPDGVLSDDIRAAIIEKN